MKEKVTYIYRVAEQVFSVRGAEEVLMTAANMAPFRVPDSDYGETEKRFVIDVETSSPEEVTGTAALEADGYKHFFTDDHEDDMPRIEVYRSEAGWLFRIAQTAKAPICCRIQMSKDFRQSRLTIVEGLPRPALRFAIDNAAMLQFAFATAHAKVLEMHAAVVVHEGKARLFLGHSGTGKSTHARQWLAQYHSAYLLNDDNPILRVDENGKLWVYGSPWSGKTPCYRNERVPVAAIVQLEQAPANSITSLNPSQAYAYILSSCSGLKVIHEAMDGLHATISAIVLSTPVKKLKCLPDKASAVLCYESTK